MVRYLLPLRGVGRPGDARLRPVGAPRGRPNRRSPRPRRLAGENREGCTVVAQTRPIIAVIDDDESVRVALRRLIRSAGLDASVFTSAEDYLASAVQRRADCLILDVCMPGMSGLELQRRLSATGRYPPVVFITAHEDEPARRAALEAGAVGFLSKPFDDALLLDALARALAEGERRGLAAPEAGPLEDRSGDANAPEERRE